MSDYGKLHFILTIGTRPAGGEPITVPELWRGECETRCGCLILGFSRVMGNAMKSQKTRNCVARVLTFFVVYAGKICQSTQIVREAAA